MDSYGGNYEAVASGQAQPTAESNNDESQSNGNNNENENVNANQGGQAPRRPMQRRGSLVNRTRYRPPNVQLSRTETNNETQERRGSMSEIEGNNKKNQERRGSMSEIEEKDRRASIKAIMMDSTIPPIEKRKSIQALMDGRRNSKERRTSLHDVNDALASNGGNPKSMLDVAKAMEQSRPKCSHYDRKCTIVSPCCGAAFGCRICHDECPVLPPPKYGVQRPEQMGAQKVFRKKDRCSSLPASWTSMPKPQHHEINRFEIREIICRVCYTRQTSKTNQCISCHVQFGEYHCEICNLWMSAEEEPYHCSDCGFCRVGGRDNFKHCHDCGMCIDVTLFSDHNCKTGKYMSNCPVCQEDLFSSRSATHEMPCGHTIHWHCYEEYSKHDSRCPVCKKTSETRELMSQTWSAMALSIAMQPVPTEFAKVVDMFCNDCETQDQNLRWHFLGIQCRHCSSFNTSIEKVKLTGRQAALFADQMEAFRAQINPLEGNISSVGEVVSGNTNMAPSRSQSVPTNVASLSTNSNLNGSISNAASSSSRTSENNGGGLIVDFNTSLRRRRRSGGDDSDNNENT